MNHIDQTMLEHIHKRIREGLLLLMAGVAVISAIALATYDPGDPSWSHTGMHHQLQNACGVIGAWFADISLSLLGYFAYLMPIILLYLFWVFYQQGWHVERPLKPWVSMKLTGTTLLLVGITGLLSLSISQPFSALPASAGGMLGDLIQQPMNNQVGEIGTGIVFTALSLCGVTLLTGFSWLLLAETVAKLSLTSVYYGLINLARGVCQLGWMILHMTEIGIDRYRQRKLRREQTVASAPPSFTDAFDLPQPPLVQPVLGKMIPVLPSPVNVPLAELDTDFDLFEESPIEYEGDSAAFEIDHQEDNEADKAYQADLPEHVKIAKPAKKTGPYGMPHLALLDEPSVDSKNLLSQSAANEMASLVETKLNDFGVQAQVVAVHPGPVITRYELQLAAGVKVSKVSNLAKDLARSLSVTSVRIVEIIPGKTVVGLEVPNDHREIVRLREVLASKQYANAKSPLSLGLGKDISGVPVIVDVGKMPHLLVAGTTGAGKSVCLNALLLSLLYKATPEQVRLIMVDPKMLELSVYDGIPHLLTPVVTDMKEAANALRWCVAEMEKRYQLMAALGVRNIAGYNTKVQAAIDSGTPLANPLIKVPPTEPAIYLESLPYIVVLVDEFADMMMVVGKKVEELIARIAQKARAAGIHLILATQRPSVDVITGLIKANIPTRMAFQVSSKIDSRTIIDQPGAEQLLGHGDMLYLPPGAGLPVRVHGAYVADDEVHAVVAHLKKQGEPNYLSEILNEDSSSQYIPGVDSLKDAMDADPEMDPLYDQAVRVVTESRRASISLVQRRLKIGYNRAARLLEAMELAGVVSMMESNGTREVLAPPPLSED